MWFTHTSKDGKVTHFEIKGIPLLNILFSYDPSYPQRRKGKPGRHHGNQPGNPNRIKRIRKRSRQFNYGR